MLDLIQAHQHEIQEICRRFRVRRPALFGSAATGQFDPNRSDLDFLVEFETLAEGEHADAYFGLLAGLEDLFNRHIDLVMPRAIRNRFFMQAINRNRQVLYAA
ncbi:MAG: nucleotidyltransferase domain-containing protein [Phycisphaeraceae bacterium]